ncbi:MAG TPA: DUF4255 domain-containing protein [Longimicrobium sp.]|nr:DUF4255 domain-containing protein [Longimicrobium sp.]
MSDYTVIRQVNDRLREVLFAGMTGEAAQYFTGPADIHVGSPRETAELQNKALSVFLYQITEDPYMKNRPPVQNGASTQRIPPMALRFHYLITPFLRDPDGNALVLGKVLETMYDHATLTLTDPVTQETEEVRVVYEALSLSDLAEVWEALREPYRVSVAYQLRVPKLESTRLRKAVPVGESTADFGNALP